MGKTLMKTICLLLAILILPLSAMAEAVDSPSYTVEGKTYPHLRVLKDEESPTQGEMTLYYVNGGDIPYISLADFMPFLADLELAVAEWDVSYDVLAGENEVFLVSRSDNDGKMIVNAKDDTIMFTNFDLFISRPGSSSLVCVLDLDEPETMDPAQKLDYIMRRIQEGEPMSEEEIAKLMSDEEEPSQDLFALASKPFNRSGMILSMNLADYGIDIVALDGVCYVPFQTLNDIFIPPFYVYYVFNGESVIGAAKGSSFIDTIYEAEPRDMSPAFAAFNFSELCFNLDHFYGLKTEHGIDRFSNMLAQNFDLFQAMTCGNPASFDTALSKLVTGYLDDGHSGYLQSSWYSGNQKGAAVLQMMADLGMSSMRKLSIQGRLQKARDAARPDGIPGYEEIGDTAFITFNSFTINRSDTAEYYNLENPDDPQDTIELILYAHRQITREGSPVKNIVIDLSLNGGGDATAAVFVTAWFAGRAVIDLRDPLTDAQSIVNYMVDANLNGLFTNDPGDTVSGGEYNLYCMISPCSFSCGNLLPGCFRESGVVTLIGQKSGGGSCVVRPCTTASGAVFQISGSKQLTTVINGSFYNIDQGIEPDIRLTKFESFYDREALVDLIHSIR